MRPTREYRWTKTLVLAGALSLSFLSGCVDRTVTPGDSPLARFSMTTVFPDGAREHAAFLDAWRVRVIRTGEGVIEENGGTLGQTQATVEVEFSVELTAPCEVLTVQVELSTSGQVWFRANGDHQVCAGLQNEIQIAELEWVEAE